MLTRQTITFAHPLLNHLQHPAFEARGKNDGPRLTVLGGIHGCEYSSIAAVTRFMTELDTNELSGSILAVPVVSLDSFRQRSAFVVPADGKNLNRSFPGDPDGTFTDALAHSIFEELIAPADVLVDLHGGDLVEALVPFTLYDESDVEEESLAIAAAFGLPYIIRAPRGMGGVSGMTSTTAAERGIPAVIAEAGGCGQLEEDAVQVLAHGLVNVARHLGMLPGEPERPPDLFVLGDELWLRCEHEGWWEAAVQPGDEVGKGDVLGRVKDLWGVVHEVVTAPEDGVVMFLTTSAAVAADGLLLGLGTGITPYHGSAAAT
jgi:uncharacterized protein